MDALYYFGIPEIDHEHEELFRLNAILKETLDSKAPLCDVWQAARNVYSFAQHHVLHEEGLIANWEGAEAHKGTHDRLLGIFYRVFLKYQACADEHLASQGHQCAPELAEVFIEDMTMVHEYIREWFEIHIRYEDTQFISFLKGVGQ